MLEKEFGDLAEESYHRVYSAALAMSREPEIAKDATQEAFARALVRWKRLRKHPSPGGWVMTTALNFCRKELSISRRARRAVKADYQASEGTPHHDSRIDLSKALQKLTPRRRQITILYYFGGYSIQEIADLTDRSPGTVKAHLSQTRELLRQHLEVHNG